MANMIGQGAYGQVWSKIAPGNVTVAMKIADVKEDSMDILQASIRELRVLSHKSEYVVSLLRTRVFHAKVEIWMEKMQTDLLKLIKKQSLSEQHVLQITNDIAQGLHFIHSHCVLHRDIKPSNILISEYGDRYHAKLCDFGLSRQFCNELHRGSDYVVTRWYRAPEIFNTTESYGFGVDVWAFGCVVYEMQTRTPLFKIQKEEKQLKEIHGNLGDKLDQVTNDKLCKLLVRVVDPNPRTRWTIGHVIEHLTDGPPPVYDKQYRSITIDDTDVEEWTKVVIKRHPGHERTIIHALVLFERSGGKKRDFKMAIVVASLLYESIKDNRLLDEYVKDATNLEIAKWACKYAAINELSEYEINKDVHKTLKSIFGSEEPEPEPKAKRQKVADKESSLEEYLTGFL